ncbi:hypothetical protein BVRB_6g127510 [Beta vulgaris subsp. vulgaris]|nr:hypothetical protein BVRB_6g127510 [Beta vulgaris subsp. vulgaris]
MAHTKEVHVLMVTLFYHGHINPMVHFAKLLASKGLHVTLATTNHAREKILNGLATRTNFIDYEFFDDGLDIELDRDSKLASLIEEYLPRDGAKNLSNLISILEEKGTSSVIYIALGSISVLSQSETEALAMALESDSNKRFLWVRKEGEKILGRKMGELPKEFLENTKDRGLIVPWCCQEKVLTHPSIKCFLTHCGWNSTLETITAGIPVIAYPDWTDQPTNAKLLVDVFKVGVRMSKSKDGQLGREEIERCLLEVTKGPKALAMKEQAIKLKVLAKKATMSGGSSNMNVDNFVNELSAKSV